MKTHLTLSLLLALASCTYNNGPQISDSAQHSTTPWSSEVICAADGVGGAHRGADGSSVIWIGGSPHVAIPWEQSSKVSVASRNQSTGVWTCTDAGTNSSAEATAWGDFDGDGNLDVVSSGEGKQIKIHWGPTWTTLSALTAATNVARWMTLAAADMDGDGDVEVIAGGRLTGGSLDIFSGNSSNYRDGTQWTRASVGVAGWIMTIIPVDIDNDGDLDLLASDRTNTTTTTKGTSWHEQTTSGWTKHTVSTMTGEPRMMAMVQVGGKPLGVIDGSETVVSQRRPLWDGSGWTANTITMPADVGTYHATAIGDITGDGEADLVLSFSAVPTGESGVVALAGPAFTSRIEISGAAGANGAKYDDMTLVDIDEDGDLDVVTSEQQGQIGSIVYLNPRI